MKVSEPISLQSLSGIAELLRPHLEALDEAFSESEYPEFRTRLYDEKRSGSSIENYEGRDKVCTASLRLSQ